MKKTFLPRFLQVGFVCMLLCIICTTQAGAQVTSEPVATAPSGSFVLPAEAVDLLEAEMVNLQSVMDNNPHASDNYKLAHWRYVYYEYMAKLIGLSKAQTSADVAMIIVRGLRIYHSDAYGDIPKDEVENNKQAVIALLKA